MTTETELQNIDCNCNNCIFMIRDFETFDKWKEFRKELQLKDFNIKKQTAIRIASEHPDEISKKVLLKKANKMTFQFDKSDLISYGKCKKLNKDITFIPNICQIETQNCFQNRRI